MAPAASLWQTCSWPAGGMLSYKLGAQGMPAYSGFACDSARRLKDSAAEVGFDQK